MPNGLSPDKRLHNAVVRGKLREALGAIDEGASANGVPELVNLPLITAASTGSVPMMKMLIDRGADIEAVTRGHPHQRGRTAVHRAARNCQVEALEFLIGRGANVNVVAANDITPLFAICAEPGYPEKRIAVARILLDAGADPTFATSFSSGVGETCLTFSVIHNDLRMIDLLATRAPAVLDMCQIDGTSPLALAARQGYEGVVAQLLKVGARYKPGSSSGCKYVPIDAACSQGGEGWSKCPLREAIGGAHAGVVRLLLAQGFEALGGTQFFLSSLRLAVDQGRASIVWMLLDAQGESRREHWANVRFDGTPALTLAACYGSLATVSVLLAAGADETAVSDGGITASDVVGRMLPSGEAPSQDKQAAILRSLERGPAYRARSWAWANVGGDRDAAPGTAAAASAAATAAGAAGKHSSPRSWRADVRIFRPAGDKRLIRPIGRYVLKGEVWTKIWSGAIRLHDGMKRGPVPRTGRIGVRSYRDKKTGEILLGEFD